MSEYSVNREDFRAMNDAQSARTGEWGIAPGIEIGAFAPRFTLPDATGHKISLDDRLAEGPVVISFYRGAWCPICNRELHGLQEILPEIAASGASLVAISPQSPDTSLGLVEKLELGFDVLSDLDQSVIRSYQLSFDLSEPLRPAYAERGFDLTEQNADASWSLPVPATFVLDRGGIVRARHVDANYRVRMDPADLLEALRSLP